MKCIQSLLTLIFALRLVVARQCQNLTVTVSISARNGVYNIAVPSTNIEAINFALNLGQQGHNYPAEVLAGYANISGTYQLAATYCAPDHGHGKIVQILTHGIGFDRSYWDLPFDNYEYSYVAVAVDQYGYSTLSWDRLGIGMSSIPDPLAVTQAPIEQAALSALTRMTRAGSLPDVHCHFEKIVHVGHSFGSQLSYGLTRDEPTASDGIVLTGFSQNSTFIPYFLFGANFIVANSLPSLAKYPLGYLATGSAQAVQTLFFSPGNFEPAILDYAVANGQPVTVGELLSLGSEATGVNPFAGPVLIITGNRDLPFCGGDCSITGDPALPSIPYSSRPNFPNTSDFEVIIVPNGGHGLNLELNHDFTYQSIQQFFVRNGITGRRGRKSGRAIRV